MDCREVRSLAEAFVSDQLMVETTQAVVAHLEHCAACRAEVQGLRRLRAATRGAVERAPDLAPRPQFAAELVARLRQDSVAAEAATPAASRRAWLLALAAGMLLIVGAGVGVREWSRAGFAALLHAAIGDHRFCALHFSLAEHPITLEEASQRYGGVDRLLETVEPSAAALTGGPLRVLERHSCVYDGRRFAHIVLRYKNELVSLMVTEDQRPGRELFGGAGSGPPAALPVTDGFHAASFRGANHVVFVVSSLDDADVREVARAMFTPIARALAGA